MKNKDHHKKINTTKTTDAPQKTEISVYIPWILVAASLLLYGWTANFDFCLDDDYITSSLSKIDRTFKGLVTIFTKTVEGSDYRPVTMTTFWIERQIFNEIEPGISHLINVIIFGTLLAQMFKFFLALNPYKDEKKSLLLSTLICVFFLVLTNHVSVVANIKSRDNLLSMLWGILASRSFLKAFDNKQSYHYAFFFVFSLLAMWSKSDAYSLILLPFLSILFFRNLYLKRIILLVASSIITLYIIFDIRGIVNQQIFEKSNFNFIVDPGENPLVLNPTLLNKLSMGCISFWTYIKFSVLPFGHHFFFGYDMISLKPFFHIRNIEIIIFAIILFILCIFSFKKNPLYLFSYLFFGISIGYALNIFVPVAGIVADRYNFIPSLSFCIVLSAILIDTLQLINLKDIFNKYILIIVLIYAVFTIKRTADWKDIFTLYTSDISKLEKSYNANRLISAAYLNKGLELEHSQPDIAEEYFKKAEEYADKAHKVYQNAGPTWSIKGINQLHWGDNRKALEYFMRSASVDSLYLPSINYIGVAYRNMGMMDSAYYYFHKVMLKENYYNYSADNLVTWYITMNQSEKLDSLIQYYNGRFPDDLWLKRRTEELKKDGYLKY